MLSIEDFLDVMRSEGVQKSATKNAQITLNQLNDFKPLPEVEYIDIARFINHIREKHGYKKSTLAVRKAYIKKYFRYHDRDDIIKKLQVKHEPRHLNPNDILAPEDINYLLKHMDSPMYKAIITVLYESGARINEALAVKIDDDIKEVNIGYDLTLYADKTRRHTYAYREMYLTESAPYLREWLMVRSSDSDFLFPLTSRAVGMWLQNLRENLNFPKPLNPHAFRHGCATRLVKKGMQESLIRKQLGWSSNSNMISVYVHLANTDLKTYQRMQAGEEGEEAPLIEITKPKETYVDRISQQERDMIEMREMLQTVMKDNLEMKAQLESQTTLHPDEFEIEDARPDMMPTTAMSVDEIKEEGKNFEGKMKKAIEEEAKKNSIPIN